MSTRQAVAITVTFVVLMVVMTATIIFAANLVKPSDIPTQIVTIKSCPKTCEILV